METRRSALEVVTACPYRQIFDSLENLNVLVDDVFSRLTTKVLEERDKVQRLSLRLGAARSKVKHLEGTAQAVTVMSPAKYPVTREVFGDELPLFPSETAEQVKKRKLILSFSGDVFSPFGEGVTPEEKSTEGEPGLGRLPAHISTVSSLVLFNSTEQPYKIRRDSDNLLPRARPPMPKSYRKSKLTAPPKTFSEGDQLMAMTSINYTYRPQPGVTPIMEVPDVIPGLQNVASLQGPATAMQPIAPSFFNVELPSFVPEVAVVPNVDGQLATAQSTSSPSNVEVVVPKLPALPEVAVDSHVEISTHHTNFEVPKPPELPTWPISKPIPPNVAADEKQDFAAKPMPAANMVDVGEGSEISGRSIAEPSAETTALIPCRLPQIEMRPPPLENHGDLMKQIRREHQLKPAQHRKLAEVKPVPRVVSEKGPLQEKMDMIDVLKAAFKNKFGKMDE